MVNASCAEDRSHQTSMSFSKIVDFLGKPLKHCSISPDLPVAAATARCSSLMVPCRVPASIRMILPLNLVSATYSKSAFCPPSFSRQSKWPFPSFGQRLVQLIQFPRSPNVLMPDREVFALKQLFVVKRQVFHDRFSRVDLPHKVEAQFDVAL